MSRFPEGSQIFIGGPLAFPGLWIHSPEKYFYKGNIPCRVVAVEGIVSKVNEEPKNYILVTTLEGYPKVPRQIIGPFDSEDAAIDWAYNNEAWVQRSMGNWF
jgi:hypothetical protein